MTKRKAQRAHARRRASERYGIEVGKATRGEILAAIQGHRSRPVRRTSLRSSVHDVDLSDGTTVRVVYDRQRKELVTFLPEADVTCGDCKREVEPSKVGNWIYVCVCGWRSGHVPGAIEHVGSMAPGALRHPSETE